MNVVNSRRSELQSVPYLNHALDDIASRINVVFTKEHTLDGEHTDITADSVTTETLTVSGTVEGPLNFGTEDDPILLDGEIVGPGEFTDYTTYPVVSVTADVSRDAFVYASDLVPETDATQDLGYHASGVDTTFLRRWRNLLLSGTARAAQMVVSSGYFFGSRTTAEGHWTSVAFSAANFTGNGAMTWTLAAGDQVRYAYTLIGKTIIIDYVFATSSVGGVADTILLVAAPGGVTFASATHQMNVAVASDNAVVVDAYVQVIDATHWGFLKRDGSAWTAAADTTAVQGTLIASIS